MFSLVNIRISRHAPTERTAPTATIRLPAVCRWLGPRRENDQRMSTHTLFDPATQRLRRARDYSVCLRQNMTFKPFLCYDVRGHNVCIILLLYYPVWTKLSHNLLVIYLLLSVSLGVLFSVISISMQWAKNRRRAQTVTLHGEGYTERDIAAKFALF